LGFLWYETVVGDKLVLFDKWDCSIELRTPLHTVNKLALLNQQRWWQDLGCISIRTLREEEVVAGAFVDSCLKKASMGAIYNSMRINQILHSALSCVHWRATLCGSTGLTVAHTFDKGTRDHATQYSSTSAPLSSRDARVI